MAAERCPLCQSKLRNGECESCGYRLPDEDNISAYYNYDPSDYPQEQPAVREITPEYQMEEIYPDRPEPLDFKVRNDEGKTVQSPYGQNNGGFGQTGQQGQNSPYQNYGQYRQTGQYGGQNGGQNYYGNNQPYGQYKQFGQYGNGQNQQYGQPFQPYYRNNGQYGQYPQRGQYGGSNQTPPYYQNYGGYQFNGNNSQGMGSKRHRHRRYWLPPFVTFLFPFPIGLIIFAIVSVLLKSGSTSIEPKYRNVILTALILGAIFSPFSPF